MAQVSALHLASYVPQHSVGHRATGQVIATTAPTI